MAKEVYEWVTGEESCPTSPPDDVKKWKRNDLKARGIIQQSISLNDSVDIENCPNAYACWKRLETRHRPMLSSQIPLRRKALEALSKPASMHVENSQKCLRAN